MATSCDPIPKIIATIRRYNMLPRSGVVVLGVSGGPDSLALLHLMCGLCKTDVARGVSLHIGHLHHGLRGAEADKDVRFVEEQCAKLGVSCTIEFADIPALARDRGVGEEEAGRDARYDFLTRLTQSVGAQCIALGHHADDQAETVLMRLKRGAGPRGMGGIPYTRPVEGVPGLRIIRPLLDCTRAEIEDYLKSQDLSARLDATNLTQQYWRNRIRAETLPAFEAEWGASLREDLCNFARLCRRLHIRGRALCESFLAGQVPVSGSDGGLELDADWLKTIPKALHPDLVDRLLEASGLLPRMLTSDHYAMVSALIEEGEGAVSMPGGIEASLSQGKFLLRLGADDFLYDFQAMVNVPGSTEIPPLSAKLEVEILPMTPDMVEQKRANHDPNEALFDLDRVSMPLVVRFWRPGDAMKPLGAPGTRKLQDIFTDEKIPRPQRRQIPLLTMNDRPVWIVGHRIADDVKLTAKTQNVLRIICGRHENIHHKSTRKYTKETEKD